MCAKMKAQVNFKLGSLYLRLSTTLNHMILLRCGEIVLLNTKMLMWKVVIILMFIIKSAEVNKSQTGMEST